MGVSGGFTLDQLNPAGAVQMFAGSSVPGGWLLCDGSAVSRTIYSKLFSAIGTTYGAGDGSTTFNLPNLQGTVPVGYKSTDANFNALGKTGGESTHTLTIAEMPSHGHDVNDASKNNVPVASVYAPSGGSSVAIPANSGSATNGAYIFANNKGGGGAHNNLQPYLVLNYIIKV